MSTLSDRLASLSPQHQGALRWFEDRRGELVGKPEPVDDVHVFNPQTGIQKPAGWRHAVSIRQTLTSKYDDHLPRRAPDGSWTYSYFQERTDPAKAARLATNLSLIACMEDDVPVAVMIQEKPKPGVRYRVWGLAKVVGFADGHFHLQGYTDAGELPERSATIDLEYAVGPASFAAVAEPPLPISSADARQRIEAQIFVRQGGGAFRSEALKRFNGRCAISGCDVLQVLEAAHIVPYLGPHTNTPDNALLLRADLHTLFDRDLLIIDPDTLKVRLAAALEEGSYGKFSGREITLPNGIAPETLRTRLLERANATVTKEV